MIITWSRGFPVEHRRWVAAYVRRCARAYGLQDWEFALDLQAGKDLAASDAVLASKHASVGLRRERLGEREAIRADLRHEMLHVARWGVVEAFGLLVKSVSPARRGEMRALAYQAMEADHERLATAFARYI